VSKRLFFLLILLLVSVNLNAQILDDSTQNLYGPRTTNYKYLNDIKLNRNISFHPDTSIIGFERFSYMENYRYKLQDLGNIGTSAKFIFYTPPVIIGKTSGYYSYALYNLPIEKIRLFNTRSPHTDLFAGFASGNRNITRITHSQSIKPNWNFGLNLQWLTNDKQISSTGRGDNQVRGLAYNFYMYYWTPDSNYFALGAFTRMHHKVVEIGGVDTLGFSDIGDFFDENAELNLQDVTSTELDIKYYLYQQYQLNPAFAIYNELSRTLTSNYFTDANISTNKSFYDYLLFNTSETWNKNKFNDLTNEAGVKGDWKKAFYNAYYKYRNVSFNQLYLAEVDRKTEGYIGGSIRYDNDSSYYLSVSGELMLNNANHQINAVYENRFWELSYKRMMYDPGAIHEKYFGNHYEWYNNLGPVQSDNFKALFKIPLKKISINPFFNLSMIQNYIYFNENKMPSQASGFAQLYSPGLDLNIRIGRYLHWENQFIYTFKTGEEEARDVFRIPPIFINSYLYFSKFMFNEKLLMSLGINAHYQSNYYADGYDPVTQQFYLQNDFELPAYALADLFVNIKIKTVRVFLKFYYLNQKREQGYFASPYYPGQPKGMDLGLSWMFYD
jgi:hypothetical protein